MTIEQATSTIALSDQQGARLARAIGAMPFGASIPTRRFVERNNDEWTIGVDTLAEYLEALADVLGKHIEIDAENTNRLMTLEHYVRTARAFVAEVMGDGS